MDSGYERHTRPTATAVADPDVAVPTPRTAPRVESAAPDVAPVDPAPDDATATGPIPAVPAAAPPSRRTLVETDPIGFAPVGTGTTVTPPVSTPVTNPCRCGHDRDAHEHFRRGTDCAGCGCARFRKPSLLSRLRG